MDGKQLAILRLLESSGDRGMLSSEVAYGLLRAGLIACRHPRGRWKAQGAGFIGGSLLAPLARKGLVRMKAFGLPGYYILSSAGRRAILEHTPSREGGH